MIERIQSDEGVALDDRLALLMCRGNWRNVDGEYRHIFCGAAATVQDRDTHWGFVEYLCGACYEDRHPRAGQALFEHTMSLIERCVEGRRRRD